MTTVRHPLFAHVFDRMSEREERMGQAEHRQTMLDGISGRVLELGAGNGINSRHHPAAVTDLVAVEPEPEPEPLFRVVRPGGELRFYEHVRATDAWRARLQDAVTPVWQVFGGGCHPNHDTAAAIEAAAFSIESCQTVNFSPCFRRPGASAAAGAG